MICNLNQLSFQNYGTIESERIQSKDLVDRGQTSGVVELDRDQRKIYRSQTEVWIRNHENMTVLSASVDGEKYQHFYLDKVVCIKPGIYFTLHPYQERSSVEFAGEQMPQAVTGDEAVENFSIQRRLAVSRIYTFFYHEKEKGFIFPGEAHRPLELTYVDKGAVHSVADGVDLLLNQGELVLYAPDQWHMQYAEEEVAASYITISFDLEGECPEGLFNRKFSIPQMAVPVLQQLLREQERPDAHSEDMMLCYLQILLLTLLRDLDHPAQGRLRTTNAVNSENEIIRRAQQFISAHIREKLTVPVVARHVDVSPSYLTALFRKNLQISPGEYIRRVKLQESKQMIREDHMNFTEIAAVLQYSTVHHFSRQFKDKFGITPTEYAKSVR